MNALSLRLVTGESSGGGAIYLFHQCNIKFNIQIKIKFNTNYLSIRLKSIGSHFFLRLHRWKVFENIAATLTSADSSNMFPNNKNCLVRYESRSFFRELCPKHFSKELRYKFIHIRLKFIRFISWKPASSVQLV